MQVLFENIRFYVMIVSRKKGGTIMEICNKELVNVQADLVKKQEDFERELRYRVAREVSEYKVMHA